jgi:ferredoxin
MIRKIIEINEEKCNGCGACAAACHEGAIGMVDGKAKLMRDDYCDGLGDCLPTCPTGAIRFVEREAEAYDEAAVLAAKASKEAANKLQKADEVKNGDTLPCGCPGSAAKAITRQENHACANASQQTEVSQGGCESHISELRQWPVQIKLVPVNAPYFAGAKLLIAADCTAYACADFHRDFIKGHITLVGCPKLDAVDYSEKLTEIIKNNDIRSVTIVRMEVPCCGGLEMAAKKALQNSGKFIPWNVVTISTDGRILDRV